MRKTFKASPLWILLFVFIGGLSLNKLQAETIRQDMHELVKYFSVLRPYIINENEFIRPEHDEKIRRYLKKMASIAKKASHHQRLKTTGFKISHDILEEHIQESLKTFNSGSKLQANWMLKGTANICMSCHSQVPTQLKPFFRTPEKKTKVRQPFYEAEYLFVVRDFETALNLYIQSIQGRPKNGVSLSQATTALERILTITLRTSRDPKAAEKILRPLSQSKNLPDNVRKQIISWLDELKRWPKNLPNPEVVSADKLLSFVKEDLNRSKKRGFAPLVTHIRNSGLLYEFMDNRPHTLYKSEILYYLALTTESMIYSHLHSLAEIYLKECIKSSPGKPIARKCFNKFEDDLKTTYARYLNESGQLPKNARRQLSHYRRLAN